MKNNFIKLYDKCFDDIYRYVYFKTGSKWEAEDLVSETFRKAYENFHLLKGEPKPWLMSIARNTVIDFYRRKKDIMPGSDELDNYAYNYPFDEVFERKEELSYLKESLNSLSKDELEIVNLRYFSDLKYKQIGEMLGKTESAIKMKVTRINQKLIEVIKRRYREE
ncbi:MAG TPA: RNA polymerase sigma factor [Pseudobacteroides sp.]|uniref:RNA polymerase sigma factor n=1 Tax=Pseudobacteroides sp. TaxID=1968840 RepID=UPI002F93337C